MSSVWRVNRDGEILSLARPVYSTDSVRGERTLTETVHKRFKGIVRLAYVDDQSQLQGLVPKGSIVIYTDFELQENDVITWRDAEYSVDFIQPNRTILKALCRAKI